VHVNGAHPEPSAAAPDGASGEAAVHAVPNQPAIWGTVLALCTLEALGRFCNPKDPDHAAAELFDLFRLREQTAEAFGRLGLAGEDRWRAAARLRIAFGHPEWAPKPAAVSTAFNAPLSWMHDPDVAWIIGVNEYEGVRYFVKEPFEELLWWMSLPWLLKIAASTTVPAESIQALEAALESRMRAAAEAGYRVESLLEMGR